jgi:hypothetical protein
MAPKKSKFSESKGKTNSSSSFILKVVWLFILMWIIILIFVWHSGYLHTTNIKSLRYVDKMLNQTGHNIREGIKHMHYPQLPLSELNFEPLNNHKINEKYDIHIIFSTDCNPYQDWQSLSVFYSATVVKQKGPITRIASGCNEEKKIQLQQLYKKLYPQYHVHFTPDFKKDENSKRSCKFL